MDGTERTVSARLAGAMADIDAADWDAIANPPGQPYDPFVSHAFLDLLEKSGSARHETGWQPAHILLEDDDETGAPRLIAAAPAYAKQHSYGEYVFDHAWADAFERAGGQYYPKLQTCVPFTPAPGRRFLCADRSLVEPLAASAAKLAARVGVSSYHATFCTEEEWSALGEIGYLKRMDQQFHWENDGYATFEDFLAALSSRKRKNLKKERAAALEDGIEIEWVTGSEIGEHHWDAFFRFYMDTGSRKWGTPYLTRTFFSLLGERMADDVLLIFAKREGRYIAGALNLIGSEALYGRNWGCTEHVPFLHFEVCYYQAIDYALAHGLKYVEAGAQGGHKLARGYRPVTTRSAHWIAHPGLRAAISDYLARERQAVSRDQDYLAERTPFKKGE